METRSAGILLPITSLPSRYGIGTMGREARKFIDFLEKAGQSGWQILPLGPTGYGDSPYQSFSTFAGNPYLIDLDDLAKEGYLKPSEYRKISWGDDPKRVDYGLLYEKRFGVLRKAAERLELNPPADYASFLKKNAFWLEDYALFMAEKYEHGGISYQEWEEPLRLHEEKTIQKEKIRLKEEVSFWSALQYLFFHQYSSMKKYANAHGIGIIGDVPIYVSPDSSDIWANPELFQLGKDRRPKMVAGVPGDAFTPDGQLWGNPLYDWKKMKEDGYAWWTERIRYQSNLVDLLRIDHFRGFESYFAIPAEDQNARRGEWKKGPGIEFFRTVEKKLGKLNLIAEDLGFLTPEVIQMVKDTGYPGMKVLQFAFDPRDTGGGYLPHQYPRNCVVYAGTHDNDTIMGWVHSAPKPFVKRAEKYLHLDEKEGYNWGVLRGAYESVASLAVMQFQDILGLGSEGRINTPSTVGGNWTWRCEEGAFTGTLARKLRSWMELYGRLPREKKAAGSSD